MFDIVKELAQIGLGNAKTNGTAIYRRLGIVHQRRREHQDFHGSQLRPAARKATTEPMTVSAGD